MLLELFHTERSHVRNLKVLERVFYRPLLENGFSDLVNLLFPNLPEMLEIHGRFNAMMKARKRDQPAVEAVGDILLAMVCIESICRAHAIHIFVIIFRIDHQFRLYSRSLTGRQAKASSKPPQHSANTSRSPWRI